MPKRLEEKLRREALKKWPGNSKAAKRRRDAYVYGTMRKQGWHPDGEGGYHRRKKKTVKKRRSTMKRAMIMAAGLLLVASMSGASGSHLTFVGVACSGSWHTDLYVTGDSSSTQAPQTVTLTFTPFGAGASRSVQVQVAGGQAYWHATVQDAVCAYFGQVGSGALEIAAPFYIRGWARTWSPPGYGQFIPSTPALQYATMYEVPWYPEGYRCNLLLYNADQDLYTIASVGDDWVFLEPGEAEILMSLPPGTTFEIVSGGTTHGIISLVDNTTNDAVTIPAIPRE